MSHLVGLLLIGAGKMGRIHAANTLKSGGRLVGVVDPIVDRAQDVGRSFGVPWWTCTKEALSKVEGLDGVIIASSDSHADIVTSAAEAGAAILCEKPLSLDLSGADKCLQAVHHTGVPFVMAFQKRFDRHFTALRNQIISGALGSVEQVILISRDITPHPPEYTANSGGVMLDFAIHDFDLARWLTGEEPSQVYAKGSCLIDPGYASVGDVDSSHCVLSFPSGVLCTITNSRRSPCYDQRAEVLLTKGEAQVHNVLRSSITSVHEGHPQRLSDLFLGWGERFGDAYSSELEHFVDVIHGRCAPIANHEDGHRALAIAIAAKESLHSGLPVTVPPINAINY